MSVRPNELRLGNFINYGAHGLVIVIGLGSKIKVKHTQQHSIDNGYVKSSLFDDDLDPIPITPEWLERMGFAKDERYSFLHFIKIGHAYWSVHSREDSDPDFDGWMISNDRSDAFCHILRKVEFVHQVQNIVFSLTAQELTVKEIV